MFSILFSFFLSCLRTDLLVGLNELTKHANQKSIIRSAHYYRKFTEITIIFPKRFACEVICMLFAIADFFFFS